MSESWNSEERKPKKYSPHGKTRRFRLNEADDKPGKKKQKNRESWKIRKTELQNMDIDDLRDYIEESEY